MSRKQDADPEPTEFHLEPPEYDKVQEGADWGDLTARDDTDD